MTPQDDALLDTGLARVGVIKLMRESFLECISVINKSVALAFPPPIVWCNSLVLKYKTIEVMPLYLDFVSLSFRIELCQCLQ